MKHFGVILTVFFTVFCNAWCDEFYYFAYGSNLLGNRMKLNSPSAEFSAVAVLEDHMLDFYNSSTLWNGAAATIVETPGKQVVGCLWTLHLKDLPNLDIQEGVNVEMYFAKNVTVTTLEGKQIVARTYELINNPPTRQPFEDLPYDRRPSNTYLEVIVLGAVESGLPSDYIGFLISFPTNGIQASDSIRNFLGYPYGPK